MALDDDIRALEARVLDKAAGTFLGRIEAIRLLLAQGSPDVAKAVLALVAPKVERSLLAAVTEAYVTGAATAADIAEVEDPEVGRISKSHAVAIKGLDAELVGALGKTKQLLKVGGVDDITALAPILQAANRVRQTTTAEVVSAANLAVRSVADGAGLPSVWVAERDACVRCLAYAGKSAAAGEDFPGGLTFGRPPKKKPSALSGPSLHPHCLPFDTVVTPGSSITGASARQYDGDMVTVKTLGGHELSGTPNHPVLTRRGWIGLGFLEPGDQVVSRVGEERALRRDDDSEYVPALIGDLAEATLSALEVTAREVPVAAVDFHGDGGGSEVSAVASEGLLRYDLDGPLCEHHREELLEVAAARALRFPGRGGSSESLLRESGSADRVVGGGGPRESLLGAGLSHAGGHGGATPAPFDAGREQSAGNDIAGYAEAARDAELALAGDVALDDVVVVERYAFHGMVYNLESVGGWYIANGIVTHNCRCFLEPLRDASYAEALEREARRSVLRGYSLESETQSVRLDAAKRLLERGSGAPKSVDAFARKAIKAGGFADRGAAARG